MRRLNPRAPIIDAATITGADGSTLGNGCDIYADKAFWVQDECGKKYLMIEIEQEGGDSYYTFHSSCGVPPAGTSLTITAKCDVTSNWIKYDSLDGGCAEEPTGTITGTVWSDDCDGIQNYETTVVKGDPIFTHSVTYESVTCTQANVDCYGDWKSTGWDVIDLVVGGAQGHRGNAHDNTIVELDKGGAWTRNFSVEDGGSYCLSFDVYKNSWISTENNTFDVKINGVVVETVTASADGKIELTVDLADGHNQISFVSKSCVWGLGAGLDNVNFAPLVEETVFTEMPKEGVTIILLDANGVEVATTVTDADGNYTFSDVPEGDYQVMGVAPDGTKFTIKDAGSDDSIDSDVGSDGKSDMITVTGGETVDIDLGLCDEPDPASISGRYFLDLNRNDVDDGEPGLPGITVTLLDKDGNPAVDMDGAPVDPVVTGAGGTYNFDNLPAGTYQVKFTDPSGLTLVQPNQGADDTIDSDAIDAGAGMSVIEGITVAEGEHSADNDGGVYIPLGALSGRYFMDENKNNVDDNEPGIAGVTVVLYDDLGAPVATQTTGPDGSYKFENLSGGMYSVVFSGPAELELVEQDFGDDDRIDSDAFDLGSGMSRIIDIQVFPGSETPDNDAGVRVANVLPCAYDDEGDGCADEPITVDLSDNYSDADSASVGITMIDGIAIADGETVELSNGVFATLDGDTFIFDGEEAYKDLNIGEHETTTVSYTVEDSDGGKATADIDLTFCGDANDVASLDAGLKAADPMTVTFSLQYVNAAEFVDAYTLDLLTSTNADIPLGTYAQAYCIDSAQDIDFTTITTANVYVATEANAAAVSDVIDTGNLDLVNWLLNNDMTQVDNLDGNGLNFTDFEVQEAIWVLMNGETTFINNPLLTDPQYQDNENGVRDGDEIGTLQNVNEIVQIAQHYGEGFEAGDGDIVGLILDPTSPVEQQQPFIIGVEFDKIDCLC